MGEDNNHEGLSLREAFARFLPIPIFHSGARYVLVPTAAGRGLV